MMATPSYNITVPRLMRPRPYDLAGHLMMLEEDIQSWSKTLARNQRARDHAKRRLRDLPHDTPHYKEIHDEISRLVRCGEENVQRCLDTLTKIQDEMAQRREGLIL